MLASSFPLTDTELETGSTGLIATSNLIRRQKVIFSEHIFSVANEHLCGVLKERPALVITTPSVDRIFGAEIRNYFDMKRSPGFDNFAVLPLNESRKNMDSVLAVCELATRFNLDRKSQIVGVGGGVCTDVCGFAASIFRRGISHVKIPTTLIGLVDAGIATKNGINAFSKKNVLGNFSPPDASLLDVRFLRTVPRQHIRSGLAEILKIAVIMDPELWLLLEQHCPALVASNLLEPYDIANRIIQASVDLMLRQLAENLYESKTFERAVDFGHTFSPYIESHLEYQLLHGEAVAVDMAISTQIAVMLGMLCADEGLRILHLCEMVIPLDFCRRLNVEKLHDSLRYITAHRNGHLNLVVPTGIGQYSFVIDADIITIPLLKAAIKKIGADEF